MRSATSFFDKTLFRSQLKHTWPLWLGYTALWLFLVPVALFSELSAYQGGYSAADASGLLLNCSSGVGGFLLYSFIHDGFLSGHFRGRSVIYGTIFTLLKNLCV